MALKKSLGVEIRSAKNNMRNSSEDQAVETTHHQWAEERVVSLPLSEDYARN
jgi:hypothetical protein